MTGSPLLNVMKAAVQKAGRAIARDFGETANLQGKQGGADSFLQHAKENAEGVLLAELELAREGYGYVSSVKTHKTNSEERWLINIIDGEENFIKGIPHWSISLALEGKDGIIAGIVYDVVRDEIFFAQKGYGAFMNNRRLKICDVKEFDDAVVFSTFNAKSCGVPKTRIAQGTALYNKCVKAIRSMGAMSLDVCYVAAGRGEVCFSNITHSYEVAAAGIIAKEAGAFVSTLKGDKDFIYSGNILVTPSSLHMKALKLLNIK